MRATDETFYAEVRKPLVLVEFWAEWCQPCKKVSPIVTAYCKANTIPLLMVNTDECPAVTLAHGILAVPTILVYRNGELVAQVHSTTNKQALIKGLREALE